MLTAATTATTTLTASTASSSRVLPEALPGSIRKCGGWKSSNPITTVSTIPAARALRPGPHERRR